MTVLLPAARRLARALPPVACAALSGSALWAAFPPLTWTALAFVAWVPLIVAQFAGAPSSARVRALDGVFVGVFTGLVSVSVDPPEVITGWAWAGLSVLIGLAFGVGAALLAFPTPPAAVVRRLPRWGWVWLPALTWTGVEYLRLVTTAGHPWGMVATSQIDTAPLRALLPVAGMWPVTLLVVATNYAISALVLGVRGRSAKLVRGGRIGVVSVAAAWLAALGAAALPSPPVVGTLRVVA
ncbi:MAG: hypothetical protein FJ029_16225, partial [Actinobacteria bacterium]|nr:hypothetical protein [Actinomycetota bacterium]